MSAFPGLSALFVGVRPIKYIRFFSMFIKRIFFWKIMVLIIEGTVLLLLTSHMQRVENCPKKNSEEF